MRRETKAEGVAIITRKDDGMRLGTTVIRSTHIQAITIANALGAVQDVEAIPVARTQDVFGKLFWTEIHHD